MTRSTQHQLFEVPAVGIDHLPDENRKVLGQWMTPDWVSCALVDQYFGDLTSCDRVIEPSCGTGAFLRALDPSIEVVGVEIDPVLACRAAASTGRPIVVGDFRVADLPFAPTAIIGNPPFSTRTIEGFLDRAWDILPDEGRVGFILPAFALQTANTVERIANRWHLQQDMLPRDIFPRLMHPLCFAVLTKGARRGLVGFALYHELASVNRLQRRYKQLLATGEGSTWGAVTRAALEALGGEADLARIYREIEGNRPTTNPWWQAKVRQTLQRIAVRVGAGVWKLPEPALGVAA